MFIIVITVTLVSGKSDFCHVLHILLASRCKVRVNVEQLANRQNEGAFLGDESFHIGRRGFADGQRRDVRQVRTPLCQARVCVWPMDGRPAAASSLTLHCLHPPTDTQFTRDKTVLSSWSNTHLQAANP